MSGLVSGSALKAMRVSPIVAAKEFGRSALVVPNLVLLLWCKLSEKSGPI